MPGNTKTSRQGLSRRRLLVGGLATAGLLGALGLIGRLRRKLIQRAADWTQSEAFSASPPLLPHDPGRERTTLHIGQGGAPAENIDSALSKLGGISKVVGNNDVVILKVSAQWWNQGMTNVSAVKRTIEHILALPEFGGEVIVFENTHFRLPNGSGLSRAWTRPSERNVDVEGWNKLGDSIPHFERSGAPVSFVGLVDAARNELAGDEWHDPGHQHGVYGGDGRGPIEEGSDRDGYRWDFPQTFRLKRSWLDEAKTPLSWPRFTSPHSGLVVDLRDGVMRREGEGDSSEGPARRRLVATDSKLTWINMTTANEHFDTGFTGACKSTMGVVDMSAGRFGLDPRTESYRSVHFFGHGRPSARWRMAGPLAHHARKVRAPDLIITVAEWVAHVPKGGYSGGQDIRCAAESAARMRTVVVGTDPVAIDSWCCRNLMMSLAAENKAAHFDLSNENATASKFLRYYRQVYGAGTLDASLIEVV